MKDRWDKIEIMTKLIASVVLVAIPIMIKLGADGISRSMERAKLVESLIGELTDDQKQTRRDLAVLALDSALSPEEDCLLWLVACKIDDDAPDLVTDVALVLWRDQAAQSGTTEATKIIKELELTTAAEVIRRRKPKDVRRRTGEIGGAPYLGRRSRYGAAERA